MFRTRRQARYDKLRKAGFLKIEAQKLSVISFKVPYIKPMMKERWKDYKKAIAQDWTISEWEKYVKSLYQAAGWEDRKHRMQPWEMLRAWENRYRDKHPQYDSPWQARRRKIKDALEIVEKQLAVLPKKAPMTPEMRKHMDAQKKEMEEHFKRIAEWRKSH